MATESGVAQTLNLRTLAKSNSSGSAVPGTDLEVRHITEQQELTLGQNLWLLVLSGELIIDLPYGDFRILKEGDCLHLDAGLKISYQPLEEVVVVWRDG